ncbi:A/G-specific adenine glycosylase [Candidatus Marinamargulisbacteria bacterium SCGC AG-414-C22]|nr:A/G-specific adenine glycosylase [Candidatus Marinamargulisbacteria bacterium SCGC AG-414-C22]
MTPWPKSLLAWYRKEKRAMPWRDSPHPYKTWVSEMMLQQTQVATVIPYFNRFMNQFPTVVDLSNADEQTVLKAWEGLGYYSRARNLHKAAKIIVENYNNELPSEYDELQKLPGIGPYCAAAITSIAFNNPVPVVDGNVLRVFTRFWGIFDDIRNQAVKTMLFHKLGHFIEHENPSDFNQAIMECGALICTPKKPNCPTCPLKSNCFAYQENKQNELPVKSKQAPTPHYDIGVGIIWKNNKILIGKRKTDQMLGGLWEFPGGKKKKHETIEETIIREIKEETTLDVSIKKPCHTVKHTYSHFKITLHAYHCNYQSGTEKLISNDELRWVELSELKTFPFPKANKVIIDTLIKV